MSSLSLRFGKDGLEFGMTDHILDVGYSGLELFERSRLISDECVFEVKIRLVRL